MKDEKRYTTTQAAKLLKLSSATVLRAVKSGKLYADRTPGGHLRIPESAIEAFRKALTGSGK